jgi:hypothetical protein
MTELLIQYTDKIQREIRFTSVLASLLLLLLLLLILNEGKAKSYHPNRPWSSVVLWDVENPTLSR